MRAGQCSRAIFSAAPGCLPIGLNVPGTVETEPDARVRQQRRENVRDAIREDEALRLQPVRLIDVFLHPGAVEGTVGERVDCEDVKILHSKGIPGTA